DIGANVGYKTDLFLRMGARVVAVEPEPGGQKVLRERFLQYRITRPPLTIVGKAVSDHEGHVPMWTERPCFEMNTLSRKWVEKLRRDEQASFATELAVEAIRLDTLIAHYGRPFFIKIDVEGYELKVLRGLRSPVPYIAFEVNLPD